MKKNRLFYLVATLLLFLSTIPLLAQQDTLSFITEDQFHFSYDFCFFRSQHNYVLMELYYSILRKNLEFVPDSVGWRADFVCVAEIWKDDSLMLQTPWPNVDLIDSVAEIKPGQRLYGVGYFALMPDDYVLKVFMQDRNSGFKRSYQQQVHVDSFSVNHLAMSDIQLASQIQRTDRKNRFSKNGFTVIPNSDRFYGSGLPMLMFYSEIYNLKNVDEPDTSKYAVKYCILDSDGQLVREFPEKIRRKPGNTAVEVSGMNIISFPSGTYFFELKVRDLFNKSEVSRKSKFFIFRKGDLAASDSAVNARARKKFEAAYARVYQEMTEEQINEEFGAAAYIASGEEKKIFKKLDSKGKQSFMVEFWKKRDQTPETAKNEFRDHYLKLVNTANQKFREMKHGWRTDRGRILLLYGVPDEIERFPYSAENKPYVIWKYFSIQGGVIFVFVDKRELGRYELVHSTARGELNDPDWQRWIRPTN
ncbi:MAG: GWxTD domain-containing protein [Calditrichaeota bacterium]|nr:GWxTD domain-containing protein [Calditrichota bacterium]